MPDVVIIYERKARDYYSSYLLKYKLNAMGVTAAVCHHANRNTWWYKLTAKPKVVVSICASMTELNPGWTVMNQHRDFLRGRAPFYINLQAEQIFHGDGANYNVVSDEAQSKGLFYICWGEQRKAQMLAQGVAPEMILSYGSVALDFCKPAFSGYYDDKEVLSGRYGLRAAMKWNLFISSFPYVSYDDETLAWYHRMLRDSRTGISLEDLKAFRTISVDSQKILMDWIDRYLWDHDEAYLYRPHPGEKLTACVTDLLVKYPGRFFVIGEESVQQWIFACDRVIAWNSTAAVECYFLGKSCAMIHPIQIPRWVFPMVLTRSTTPATYDDFCINHDDAYIKSHLFPGVNVPEIQDCYTYSLGKEQTSERICEMVRALCAHSTLRERGAFTLGRVFSKYFIYDMYLSIYAVTGISLKHIFFWQKEKIAVAESRLPDDCVMTKADRVKVKKIKRLVWARMRKV